MSLHYLLLAVFAWRVVKWRQAPRRPLSRRGAQAPWLVALVSDAVLFGGLAYREHRRKLRAGEQPAVRHDRRKSTWTKTTPAGGVDGAFRPRPWRREQPHPGQDTGIPF